MSKTKVLVVSDMHCGHVSGLTPPEFDAVPGEEVAEELKELYEFRRWHWKQFTGAVRYTRPDIVIANGDLIDGPGHKTRGTEQLTTDRNKQCKMAIACLDRIPGNPKFYFSYGTGYHTGNAEDWEEQVADTFGGHIDAEHNLQIEDCVVNYRHHASGSQIPHGRFTAPAREKLWKDMWAQRGEYPHNNIIIRSHVHYYALASGWNARPWVSLTTPALQGYGSKYARRLSGTVDMGIILMEIEGEEFSLQPIIWRKPFNAAEDVTNED